MIVGRRRDGTANRGRVRPEYNTPVLSRRRDMTKHLTWLAAAAVLAGGEPGAGREGDGRARPPAGQRRRQALHAGRQRAGEEGARRYAIRPRSERPGEHLRAPAGEQGGGGEGGPERPGEVARVHAGV